MESVPATPLISPQTFAANPAQRVKPSKYNAIEFHGLGIDPLLGLPTLLTVGLILPAVAFTWRLFHNFRSGDEHLIQIILLSVLAVVFATVISDKTLSTRYVQWLAGSLATLLAFGSNPWLKCPRRVLVIGLVIIVLFTQYTYLRGALGIMATPNGSGFEPSILVVRSVLLVILAEFTTGLVWRATSRFHPGRPGRGSLG